MSARSHGSPRFPWRTRISVHPEGNLGLVQVSLPVRRNAACRARHRLISRMMLRRRQRRTSLVYLVRLVTPEPLLAGLEAPDERMTSRARMRAGMLRWRGVAAADMAALRTPAQVKPPATADVALGASCPAGRD